MSFISLFFIGLFGILLPMITLIFEYCTALSAAEYFDPIPTPWHTLAVAAVPIINSLTLAFCLRQKDAPPKILGTLSGMALFISLLYTIPYLPLAPIALPGILFYGIGLLPLAPLLAAVSVLLLRRKLKQRGLIATSGRVPGMLPAFTAVTALLLILELQPVMTHLGLAMAVSDDPGRASAGIGMLRSIGDERLLLSQCYGRQGRMVDPISASIRIFAAEEMTNDRARDIYFRVTGSPYDSVPPPRALRRGRFDTMWFFDESIGGRTIGGIITGLTLASSTIDSSIDAAAAIGYSEWTLVFKNGTGLDQEARAHIDLPPDGVVSRLTLWINGEEREAAFAGRGKVSQAYQQVVSRKRDPVLVTTDGPGRILVQLFPVPPNGGTMKVRLGITAPLDLDAQRHPLFVLPSFRDTNFGIAAEHSVWIESKSKAETRIWPVATGEIKDGSFSYQGTLQTADLARGALVFDSLSAGASSIADDLREPGTHKIIQRLETVPSARRKKIFAVVDAARTMEGRRSEIADLLAVFHGKVDLYIVLATDSAPERPFIGPKTISADSKNFSEEIRNALEAAPFTGGQDDAPALHRALELAQAQQAAVLWFHGAQPLSSPSAPGLLQLFERSRTVPELYDIELESGPNPLLRDFDRLEGVRRVPAAKEALVSLMSRLADGSTELIWSRQKIPANALDPAKRYHATSSHLARLWASDEVRRTLGLNDRTAVDAATVIAAAYGIVTPLTGAVVLETAEQYTAAGLTPPEALTPSSVPTIPEPETYALMAIGLLMLLFARHRMNRREPLRWT